MSADVNLSPWLIVVQRDADELYRHLREAFESDPQVTVIKDRRRADRRTLEAPVARQRRVLDRRRRPAPRDEKVWKVLRFRLVHRDEAMTVYEAASERPEPARATASPSTGDRRRQQPGGRAGARQPGSPRPSRARRSGRRGRRT